MNNALNFLKKAKSVEEKAATFAEGIKRDLQYEIIDALIKKRETLQEKKFDLQNFNLSTDLNKNLREMNREDCKDRFVKLIEIDYELELLEAEIKAKQKSFDYYFAEISSSNA